MPWLDRTLIRGPHLCLCTTERQFKDVLRRLSVPKKEWPKVYITPGAGATTWTFERATGEICCVVCLPITNRTRICIHALLVHEAVHVWQKTRDLVLLEKYPSEEFEAYSIQAISQTLMEAYEAQVKKKYRAKNTS